MTTRSDYCEGCPDGSNKRPIREYDLHMTWTSAPIIAFLCPACIELDSSGSSGEKFNLRKRVQLRRRLESQGQQERAE
jgi:hypothetical protein